MTARNGEGSSHTEKHLGREPARTTGPRRFYDTVSACERRDGFGVLLDDRVVRTPGKRELLLPTRNLASALAEEWQAQTRFVDPATMPLTRLANTALDGVTGKEQAVRADIVSYAGSDLACYRAEHPEGLAAEQVRHWDPILNWAEAVLGARFHTVTGIMPVSQSPVAIARIAEHIAPFGAWRLTAMHLMTTLTGSVLLTLAHHHGRLTLDETWHAANVDEDWQISRWGEDHEATVRRVNRLADLRAASQLLDLLAS